MTRFGTINDVRNYFDGSIGEGWPKGTVNAVAAAVRDRAHEMGLIYGQDWTPAIQAVLPDDRWMESIQQIIADAGLDKGNARVMTEKQKYEWAVAQQGYEGSYRDWRAMSPDERAEYEAGAAGLGN